jgi:DNA-binding phage protein
MALAESQGAAPLASLSFEPPSSSVESLAEDLSAPAEGPLVVPARKSAFYPSTHLTSAPLIADERAIQQLLERILQSTALTVAEIARRLGVSDNSVRQYFRGARSNPSLMTFLRICDAAEIRVSVELKRG